MKKPTTSRRAVLGGAGTAGLLAVAAGLARAATAPGQAPAPAAAGTPRAGYRETDHIRTYYRLARF